MEVGSLPKIQIQCFDVFVMITLDAKRGQKGMVIILCVCVRSQKFVRTSYWQTSNYTMIRNNQRILLKPLGYKVYHNFYDSQLLFPKLILMFVQVLCLFQTTFYIYQILLLIFLYNQLIIKESRR